MDQFYPFQYDEPAGSREALYQPFDLDFDTQAANELMGLDNDEVAVPPEPPILQIRAQLNTAGNWFFPNPDQQNRDLFIQGEAFRAGAASGSSIRLPLHTLRDSVPASSPSEQPRTTRHPTQGLTPQAPPQGYNRPTLTPTTRRASRLVRRVVKSTRKKRVSLETTCVCPKCKAPKRPPNAFMVFRAQKNKELLKAVAENPALRGRHKNGKEISAQAAVSSLASEWWDNLKASGEAQQYFDLAERSKAAHALANPGYKYEQSKKYRDQWGDKSCKCGAYGKNEAKRRAREEGGIQNDDPAHEEASYEGSEEEYEQNYLRITGQQASKRVGSRSTLMEPPSKRRKASTSGNTAQNSGYPNGFSDNSVFPSESYTYGGSMAPTAPMIDPKLSRNLLPRSRQSATEPNAGTMSDVEFEGLMNGITVGGGDYRNQFAPIHDAFYNGHNGQVQDEIVRPRSRYSFDSLFDMEGYQPAFTSAPPARRPSRSGSQQLSPTSRSGGMRSPRYSQG